MDILALTEATERVREHLLADEPAYAAWCGGAAPAALVRDPMMVAEAATAVWSGQDPALPSARREARRKLGCSPADPAGKVVLPAAAARLADGLDPTMPLHEAVRLVRTNLGGFAGLKAHRLLQAVGYPAPIPEPAAVAFLVRLGAVPPGTPAQKQRDYAQVVQRAAAAMASGVPEIDRLYRLFSGAITLRGVEPVCGRTPRCAVCPVAANCAWPDKSKPGTAPAANPIRQWAEDDRPREKLAAGNGRLSDSELLAIILRTGTGRKSAVDLAREILAHFGNSLHRLDAAGVRELQQVKGVGPAKAAEIRAALELGRRVADPENDDRAGRDRAASSRAVFERFRARFKTATQEEFLLLTLDQKNNITREFDVSRGTLNASIVHPRDVFRHALQEAAAAVIFVHNHPSGDPTPSSEDRALTRRLAEAGTLLGIRVLDHVVVGARGYYSFADEGDLR